MYSSEWGFALRLEPRKELEEIAPVVVIYLKSVSFIASSHGEESHLSILTTPRSLPMSVRQITVFDSTKPPSSPWEWMTRVLPFVSGPVRLRYRGKG